MTMASLFDGSGGFPLAATMCGIEPIWASEVAPFPIRVTTKRFPGMKHYGDVSKINGAEVPPVDIITFGSPCQDLSLAGKRAGIEGERSGLFYQAVRIIKEMREKTNGRQPRYIIWENVYGAFSSNNGEDFRCVLGEIGRIKRSNFDVPLTARFSASGWSRLSTKTGKCRVSSYLRMKAWHGAGFTMRRRPRSNGRQRHGRPRRRTDKSDQRKRRKLPRPASGMPML